MSLALQISGLGIPAGIAPFGGAYRRWTAAALCLVMALPQAACMQQGSGNRPEMSSSGGTLPIRPGSSTPTPAGSPYPNSSSPYGSAATAPSGAAPGSTPPAPANTAQASTTQASTTQADPTPASYQPTLSPELSACANVTAPSTNYNSTVAGGVGVGAVIGAVLGGLIGVSSGSKKHRGRNTLIGAGAGAGLGGLLGGGMGYGTAEQQQGYALQEARLDCHIAAAKSDNERLDAMARQMEESVETSLKQLDALEQDYAAKRMSRDAAMQELAGIDASTQQLQRTVDAMKQRRDGYVDQRDANQTDARGNLDTSDLDDEIENLNDKIIAAQGNLQRLVEARRVTPIA